MAIKSSKSKEIKIPDYSGKRILHLSLKKQPFEVMVTGEKTQEYRFPSGWIMSRLKGKEYDYVKFVNGYGKDKPYFICEYKGWNISNTYIELIYSNRLQVFSDKGDIVIDLGKVVEKGNLQNFKHAKMPHLD